MSNPYVAENGQYKHFSDCEHWRVWICDCGLLRHLLTHEDPESVYKNFFHDLAKHDQAIEKVFLRQEFPDYVG